MTAHDPGSPAGPSPSQPGAAVTPEPIGALLIRLRQARGFSQLRLAELLCAAANLPTVGRHEVSRWERGERVPGPFWLGWLAVVLEVSLAQLESAVAVARRAAGAAASVEPERHRLWRPPPASELLTALDRASPHDLPDLAHTWVAGPPEPPLAASRFTVVFPAPKPPDQLPRLQARLVDLRRMDDLVGGADLVRLVDQELRAAIAALPAAGAAGYPPMLRLVAEFAQLAGWVRADAGDPAGARRAYRVALRGAAAGGDRALAGYVLGSLSHLALEVGEPPDALLLARTALAGLGAEASAYTKALLLHRVALALARVGERRAAHATLAAARAAADRHQPGREPAWLYWLDQAELTAMTGRCLAALGRPLRAGRLLDRPRPGIGPRAAALYGCCLARTYLEVGEVEQACRVARRALRQAVAAGSSRAAAGLRHLHPLLLRHRDLTAVRGYEHTVEAIWPYLPATIWGRPGPRPRAAPE